MGYINTRGKSTLAIGICGRCSLKYPLADLSPDINSPGLMVCGSPGSMTSKGRWSGGYGCADMIDPYRLPPAQVEDITLQFPRPDTDLFPTTTVAPGTTAWPTNQFPASGGQSGAQLPSNGNTT